MNKLLISTLLIGLFSLILQAENNESAKIKLNTDNNSSVMEKEYSDNNATTKEARSKKQIQEQIEREEKYAREQTFYTGEEYDLSASEVDPGSLKSIPEIKPDYDFDMDDVYD